MAVVLHGDAAALHLPDESIDLIVTSPPYFALRAYTDGGEAYGGQIGSEPTPGEYIDNLIGCTREWLRVLKPTGSLWVNLGDKYAGSRMDGSSDNGSLDNSAGYIVGRQRCQVRKASSAVPTKSLMGLPWRYALRCVDDLGLILRAEVIWAKPNGLPESVRDRVRRSHEQWFHMTRSARYFAAVDEIRTPHAGEFLSSGVRNPRHGRPGGLLPWEIRGDDRPAVRRGDVDRNEMQGMKAPKPSNPLGALPGSVWTVATQPLKVPAELGVDHFAAFPMELPRRIILGWSPSGICTACGEGRRPVASRELTVNRKGRQFNVLDRPERGVDTQTLGWEQVRTITGEACACPDTTAPTRPSVVLDPFGGTGTTALVAKALGRVGITVDRSADYCRLARWRTNDPRQLERATKPATDRNRFICSECMDRNEEPLTLR